MATPAPPDAALELPECEVAPLGMEVQSTIDKRERTQKGTQTHARPDFLAIRGERKERQQQSGKTKLTGMQFGKAFSRLIYYIAYLRSLGLPDEKLLLTKVDLKSAYGRIHLVKSCTCLGGLLLLALRMALGGGVLNPPNGAKPLRS